MLQRESETQAWWHWALGLLGVLGLIAVFLADADRAGSAAAQTWTPFVLVSGLLLVGLVAQADGLFDVLGSWLAGVPGGSRAFLAASCALVLVVTATLNLDTSVVFLTPLLLAAARRRGQQEVRVLAISLLMANASSLFLPGSNLTNLIVVGSRTSGTTFFADMWPLALSASIVTAAVLCVPAVPAGPRLGPVEVEWPRWSLGSVEVVAVVVLVLVLSNAALPVCAVGVGLAIVRAAQGRLEPQRAIGVLGLPTLVGLFGLAVTAGTIGRTWSGPTQALHHVGSIGTAALGGLGALVLNNLPASALLAARHPASSAALLIGLNLGPNLLATGSLAWFLWARAARGAGATPQPWAVTRLGLVVVPLSMPAALVALWLR